MNRYLVVYLLPTDYYIKVIKNNLYGEKEDTTKYNEIGTAIVEANNKEEAFNKIEYEVINIIKLNEK